MINLSQIVVLLQASLSFLQLSIGTPQQDIAMQLATQSVKTAQVVIAQQIASQQPQGQILATSTVATPLPPANTEPPAPAHQSQTQPIVMTNTIEIINPINGKGLGRHYTAQPQVVDESNYIELGLIVRDQNGNVLKDVPVEVTATDESQNKTMTATGNVVKIWEGDVQVPTSYYPFHYEFHTAGQHTITFKQGAVTQSVTLDVAAPDPA